MATCTSCGEPLGEGRSVCAACGYFNAVAAVPPAPKAPTPAGGPLRTAGPGGPPQMGARQPQVAQPPPTEYRSNTPKVIAILVALVVVAGGIFLFTRDDGGSDDAASTSEPRDGLIPGAASTTTTAVSLEGRTLVDFGDGLEFALASQPEITEVSAESAEGAPITGRMWTAEVAGTDEREFVIVYDVDEEPLDLDIELQKAVRDNGAAVLGQTVEATYNSIDGLMLTGTIYETGVDGYVRAMATRLPNKVVIFGYVSDSEKLSSVELGFQAIARSISIAEQEPPSEPG